MSKEQGRSIAVALLGWVGLDLRKHADISLVFAKTLRKTNSDLEYRLIRVFLENSWMENELRNLGQRKKILAWFG